MGPEAMREADADLAALRVKEFMHLRHRPVEFIQDRLHSFAKELPDRRKLQIPPLLHEQIHSQLLLQLMNLAAYRRLCDMQLLRRSGDMFLLGNLQKILQLSKLHDYTLPYRRFRLNTRMISP